MDAKLKHLEMIQAVITRMAHNSFFLKAGLRSKTVGCAPRTNL